MIFQNHFAHSLFLILIYSLTKNSKPLLIIRKCLFKLLCNLSDILFSYLFLVCKYSLFHLLWRNDFLYFCKHFFWNCTTCIFMFCLSNFCYNLIDKCNNRLVNLMTLINCFYHLLFWNLICPSLYHDNFLACRSHCKLQITIFPLFLIWIDHKLTIHKPHLCCCTRAIKRNVRN